MKKIIVFSLLSILVLSSTAFAQTVPTSTSVSGVNQGLGQEISATNKDVVNQIRALRTEMNTKIKMIRSEYQTKIDTIRTIARAKIKELRTAKKKVAMEQSLQLKKSENNNEHASATTSASQGQ